MGEDEKFLEKEIERRIRNTSQRSFDPGSLVVFRKMKQEQIDVFLSQLSDSINYKLAILRNIIKDDAIFLEILDLLAGTSISIPKRKQSFQYLDRTYMYFYCKNHNFTEDAFYNIAKMMNEKTATVKNKVLRVSKLLDGEEYESLVKAQIRLKAERKAKREQKNLEENKKFN